MKAHRPVRLRAESVMSHVKPEQAKQPGGDRHDEETKILERIRRSERVEHYETMRQSKHGSRARARRRSVLPQQAMAALPLPRQPQWRILAAGNVVWRERLKPGTGRIT
jgi:hypothetical protein